MFGIWGQGSLKGVCGEDLGGVYEGYIVFGI